MDNVNGPSDEQWGRLLQFVEEDFELLTGQFQAPNGVVRVSRKWEKIADDLNSMPGVRKTGPKWREAWGGLKNRAREQCRSRLHYIHGTGGGPPPEFVGLGLSDIHCRVLNMLGPKSVVGCNAPNPLQLQLNAAAAVPDVVVHGLQPAAHIPEGVVEAPAPADPNEAGAAFVPLPVVALGDWEVDDTSDDALLMGALNIADADIEWERVKEEDEVPLNENRKVKEEIPTITIEDTPEAMPSRSACRTLFHTPPVGGTGFTPAAQRRLMDLTVHSAASLESALATLVVSVEDSTAALRSLVKKIDSESSTLVFQR